MTVGSKNNVKIETWKVNWVEFILNKNKSIYCLYKHTHSANYTVGEPRF